jgi:hypothetical protein|tara:strand:- start:801 stop:1172 length:372 start_codon:yes stop_codon:yes gene_type:complete
MDEDKMLKLLNNADPEAVARAMQNTTMQEMADSASRSLALEQLDENKKQIKLKLKPKKRSNRDEAIMLAEKQRRMRAKNKAKPMGKKDGGMVKGYMGGGEVHMDDSPNSGMITTKGWGKSRAT